MNLDHRGIILILLLTTVKLLTMEEMAPNPLLSNATLFTPKALRKYSKDNSSSIRFRNKSENKLSQSANSTLSSEHSSNRSLVVKSELKKSRGRSGRFMEVQQNGNIQNTPQNVPIISNIYQNSEGNLENCGKDCSRIWNPVADLSTQEVIPYNNQFSQDGQPVSITENPFLVRYTQYLSYANDPNIVSMPVQQPNNIAQQTTVLCNNNTQNCFMPNQFNNVQNVMERRELVYDNIPYHPDYSKLGRDRIQKTMAQNNWFQTMGMQHKPIEYVSYDGHMSSGMNTDNSQYSYTPPPTHYQQSNDDTHHHESDSSQFTQNNYDNIKHSDYNSGDSMSHHYPEKPRDYQPGNTAVQYWDGSNVDQSTDEVLHEEQPDHDHQEPDPPTTHDEHSWLPTKSEHNEEYYKWLHEKKEQNKYEDTKAISKLQDMYYCNKYCHCCKKGPKIIRKTHYDFGPLGKMFRIFKYFGFDSGYNFFYGRSNQGRAVDDSKGMYEYVKNIFNNYYAREPSERYVEDETFVFFNKDKGEPHGVSDCKEVCSCCDSVKQAKLRAKIREMKLKEAKKKEKLQGFTGLIRHLIFSDDDGRYDFVDDDEIKFKGRSMSDDNDNDDEDEDIIENTKLDRKGYTPQYYGRKRNGAKSNARVHIPYSESNPDDLYSDHPVDHEIHDVHHDHGHDVEHHHQSKLFVFDCSKCCQFCKKPGTRRRRRKKKKDKFGGIDVLDFLRGLLTGKPPPEADSYDYEPTYYDGDQSFSYAGGTNYLYDTNLLYTQGLTPPAASSNSTCCLNQTYIITLLLAMPAALAALNLFSPTNAMFVMVVPLIMLGFILLFLFLLAQAIIPVYLIPILIMLLILSLIPILLMVMLTSLMLPLLMTPVALPLLLRLPGEVGDGLSTNGFDCIGSNCTMGSSLNGTISDYTNYLDESNDSELETTTMHGINSLDDLDTSINLTDTNEAQERQWKIPKSLYWKLNSVLGAEHCLERAGCHLAVYTHSIAFYNKFIFRVLESMSLSLNDSKFTAYKDAYQLGSLNTTNHDRCTVLYYCTAYEKYLIK